MESGEGTCKGLLQLFKEEVTELARVFHCNNFNIWIIIIIVY